MKEGVAADAKMSDLKVLTKTSNKKLRIAKDTDGRSGNIFIFRVIEIC